jgi:hypothetical protein
MSLLSPRFLALPLIALTVILSLPRPSADAQVAAARPTVMKAVTCGSAQAPASCIIAASTNSVVR